MREDEARKLVRDPKYMKGVWQARLKQAESDLRKERDPAKRKQRIQSLRGVSDRIKRYDKLSKKKS